MPMPLLRFVVRCNMIQHVLFFVHIAACVVLIALVLVQQGKGADMSASFSSGGGHAVLNQGGDFLGQLTKYSAIIFFVVCIALSSLSNRQMRLEQSLFAPAAPAVPLHPALAPVTPTGIPD